MTEHLHDKYVTGCYRCEVGLDEASHALEDRCAEATALLRRVWTHGPIVPIELAADIAAWLDENA